MSTVMIASQIGLWVVVLCLLAVTFAMVRQIGLIHRRLVPVGARVDIDGPAVGEPAPAIEVRDLGGRRVTLDASRGRSMLLVFVSPGCPACGELMPAVRSIWRSERRRLDVVLFSLMADETENRDYIRRHNVGDIPYVIAPELREAYRVTGPPYAVLVGTDGVVKAKGLVNHLDHLESLLTAAQLGHPTIESYMGVKPPVAEASVTEASA